MLASLLICSIISALFPANQVFAKLLDSIEGVVTFDRRFVTIKPHNPGESLRILMRYDPQDQQELRNHSGFFVLDENNLRAVYGGGSPIFNNVAAGSRDNFSPPNELFAAIGQALGEYTVVIYNDTHIPLSFQLSVENGTFPMEVEEPQTSPQSVETSVQVPIESREVATKAVLNETYLVQSGDTLSSIAERLYGDFVFYKELCTYNNIADCNIINVGQSLRTPSLSLLTNAAPPTPAIVERAASTPVSVAASSGQSYTVVAGDSLTLIADRFYGDFQRYREICSFNNLPNCSIISVGQVIRIPDTSTAKAIDASVTTSAALQTKPVPPSPTATPEPAPAPLPVVPPTPVVALATPIPTAVAVLPTTQPGLIKPTAIPTLVSVPTSEVSPIETGGTDITSLLESSSDKNIFLLLWNTAGLADVMKRPGPMTYFVPHDAAFVLILQSNLNMWMAKREILSEFLSYNVVAQSFDPTTLGTEPVDLVTLAGSTIRVERTSGGLLKVNDARVIGVPTSGSNGTIYTIDQVLSPPEN